MPDLASLQAAMKAALLGNVPDEPLKLALTANGHDPLSRLQIHRNTLRLGLTDCLVDRYPACRAFVGDDFWRGVARAYVARHAPASAVLNEYGAAMGDFLDDFEPVAGLPYLADLARLEWLIHQVQGSSDGHEMYLTSPYPIFDLWQAAAGHLSPDEVRMETGGQSVRVIERNGEIFVKPVESEGVAGCNA